jgi:hypothetical protein
MNEVGQISLLETLERDFRHEYARLPLADPGDGAYYVNNRAFGSVDGEVLYAMIRHLRPRRVIEIGSGFSTRLTLQALAINRDEGYLCDLTAIEPFPPPDLERFAAGPLRLLHTGVQAVTLSEFSELGAGDILFIDSTHVLRIGSDVQFEFLEVLPRLKPGVVIHVHDIFLPAEYPQDWVLREHRFWNEQYVLQALLTWTRGFEVLWGGSFMHLRHPELLLRAFPSYVPDRTWPGSFWMRRTEPLP